MATIKFYPHKQEDNTAIYLRLKVGRIKDIRLSTGLTLQKIKDWNKDKQEPKATTQSNKNLKVAILKINSAITNTIDLIEKSQDDSLRDINGKWLKDIILKETNEEKPLNLDLLVNYGNHFCKSLESSTYKKNGVKYKFSEKTISKYKNVVRHFKEYQQFTKKDIYIFDITQKWSNDFAVYLRDEKKLAINTVGKFITRLKTILKSAEQDNIKVNIKYRSIESFEDETLVTFLNFEELEQIIRTKLPTERLQIAKEWLIIASYTAQRISDLFRLTSKNIHSIDGHNYIVLKQFKNKETVEVQIPIHYHVATIIKKYNGFPPNLSMNEQSNRSMLSSLIKEVCRIARITEIVEGRYNGKKGMYPKYKLISNHSGRRSFACNFYNQPNWSASMIMNLTGHKTESSFYKYIDKRDQSMSKKANELFALMEVQTKQSNLTIVKEATNDKIF